MDYVRLLTSLSEHRKWLETSDRGHTVLIAIWCYCGRNETDGYVPAGAAAREGLKGKVADELETRGWIHRNGAGWVVHDWDEHQISAAELKAERAHKRELAKVRKQRQRERDREEGHA